MPAITPLAALDRTSATFKADVDTFFATSLPAFSVEANTAALAMNLNSTNDTSSTSNAIGTGAKTFTVSTGKSFLPGMYLVIADTAAASTNSMYVQVTSYNSGTGALVVNSVGTKGSGTKTAWTISQSIPSGHLIGYYASGEIIQQLIFTDAGSTISNSAFINTSVSAKVITPKSTNSTLIIECISAAAVASGGAGTNTTGNSSIYYLEGTTTVGSDCSLGVVSGAGANVQTNGVFVNMAFVANASTSAKSFTLHAKYNSAACNVTASSQYWKITEVQN